jgi:hypothetical protein
MSYSDILIFIWLCDELEEPKIIRLLVPYTATLGGSGGGDDKKELEYMLAMRSNRVATMTL